MLAIDFNAVLSDHELWLLRRTPQFEENANKVLYWVNEKSGPDSMEQHLSAYKAVGISLVRALPAGDTRILQNNLKTIEIDM